MIKFFLWRAISEALAGAECIHQSRGITLDTTCPICGTTIESICHVLFGCSMARQIFALANILCPFNGFSPTLVMENLSFLLREIMDVSLPANVRDTISRVLWNIWKNRNGFILAGRKYDLRFLEEKAWDEIHQWKEGNKKPEDITVSAATHGTILERKWRKLRAGILKWMFQLLYGIWKAGVAPQSSGR